MTAKPMLYVANVSEDDISVVVGEVDDLINHVGVVRL